MLAMLTAHHLAAVARQHPGLTRCGAQEPAQLDQESGMHGVLLLDHDVQQKIQEGCNTAQHRVRRDQRVIRNAANQAPCSYFLGDVRYSLKGMHHISRSSIVSIGVGIPLPCLVESCPAMRA